MNFSNRVMLFQAIYIQNTEKFMEDAALKTNATKFRYSIYTDKYYHFFRLANIYAHLMRI